MQRKIFYKLYFQWNKTGSSKILIYPIPFLSSRFFSFNTWVLKGRLELPTPKLPLLFENVLPFLFTNIYIASKSVLVSKFSYLFLFSSCIPFLLCLFWFLWEMYLFHKTYYKSFSVQVVLLQLILSIFITTIFTWIRVRRTLTFQFYIGLSSSSARNKKTFMNYFMKITK